MSSAPRVLIVGGGIASFLLGIELHDRLPHAKVTIVSADDEARLGGHLASWDEGGYPIEHGLHALFGFYETALTMLERVGAMSNFTRSKPYTFVSERGGLHAFNPATWLLSYDGFGRREKLALTRLLPSLGLAYSRAFRDSDLSMHELDSLDFRELARQRGMPRSVVESNFVRQLYDAPFNEPGELSATVAVQGLAKIFSRPWHYYFDGSSRECLIDPLREHFERVCGGTLRLGARVRRPVYDATGLRATGVELVDTSGGVPEVMTADEIVFAVGLEDFKSIDFGRWADAPYFRNAHRLRTVSSIALQAWFRDDPVPAHVDSLVCGLSEPLSIFCPATRVRASSQASRRALPHEVVACGPEAGFEDVADDELARRHFAELNRLGFSFPIDRLDDPAVAHVSVRRNRHPAHRYLYTPPRELGLRPTTQSPIENVTLAGAWIRNPTALPCVESAAESARAAAETISARVRSRAAFLGMPRVGPLVLGPPFEFRDVVAWMMLVDVDQAALDEYLPSRLRALPGCADKALLAVFDHREVLSPNDPTKTLYSYQEIAMLALVHDASTSPEKSFGVMPVWLYLNDDVAVAAGREVYGYPKKLARVDVGEAGFSVVRAGRAPGDVGVPGRASPIEILRGAFRPSDDPDWALGGVIRAVGALAGVLPVDDPLVEIPFYNCLELPRPSSAATDPLLSRITRMPARNLVIRRATRLVDAHVELRPSAGDPIHRMCPRGGGELPVRVAFRLEASFVMDDAESLV
jgi:uncharacterized protein with NAD-binding domain and iron-sulfur cluster